MPSEHQHYLSKLTGANESPLDKQTETMKGFQFLLLFLTLLLVSGAEAQIDEERLEELRNIIGNQTESPDGAFIARAIRAVRASGCDTRVCFAFDGSRQMGRRDFETQLDFMTTLTSIVGYNGRSRFMGIQYGSGDKVVANIGRRNSKAEEFVLDLESVRYLRSRRSVIGSAVAYCSQRLVTGRSPAKMVILGDGRSNYKLLRGPLNPAALAKCFRNRSPTNDVYAVGVGFSRTKFFTDITGDRASVFRVTEWARILQILPNIVESICSVEP